MDKKGVLFVISAPSGAGKGTILDKLFEIEKNIIYSVSSTTRESRVGEKDGVDYNFITREEFLRRIEDDDFVEWTEYCGNFYGTSKTYVEKNLNMGYDVILEIEVEGARNIKKKYPDSVSIFILPPSINELERRINKRGTESKDVIKRRIETAKKEITYTCNYDYLVVNGDLLSAVDNLKSIIIAERHRTSRCSNIVKNF